LGCEPRRPTLWGLRLPALLSGWVLPDPGARTVGGTGSERGERWLRLQRRRTARAAGRSLKTDRGRSCCGVEVEGLGSRNLTLAARQLYPSSRRSPTIWRRAHQAAAGNCRATGVAIDEFITSTQTRPSGFPKAALRSGPVLSHFASTMQPFVTSGTRPVPANNIRRLSSRLPARPEAGSRLTLVRGNPLRAGAEHR
jgi:hypothetical protein